jgi:hypothetical protein
MQAGHQCEVIGLSKPQFETAWHPRVTQMPIRYRKTNMEIQSPLFCHVR